MKKEEKKNSVFMIACKAIKVRVSFGSDISNGVNHNIWISMTKSFSSYLGDVTTKNHDTKKKSPFSLLLLLLLLLFQNLTVFIALFQRIQVDFRSFLLFHQYNLD